MKVYVSADIEGVAGITTWDEARREHPDYPPFRARMAAETRAVCEAAIAAGATELVVKDAHGTGRNLLPGDLPAPARLIRGWSGHPTCMLQQIDASFDAILLVGWHGPASAGGNPLAHTLSSRALQEVRLDGELASEFRLHTLLAATFGVPTVFVAGDHQLTTEVREFNPAIRTVATFHGFGASTLSKHPDEVDSALRTEVEAALHGDRAACLVAPPDRPVLEVTYKDQTVAYRKSWYPGAELTAANRVRFVADGMFEAMRFLQFVT